MILFAHARVYDNVSVHALCLRVSVCIDIPVEDTGNCKELSSCLTSYHSRDTDYAREHLAFYVCSGDSNSAPYAYDKCVTEKAVPLAPPTTSCPMCHAENHPSTSTNHFLSNVSRRKPSLQFYQPLPVLYLICELLQGPPTPCHSASVGKMSLRSV